MFLDEICQCNEEALTDPFAPQHLRDAKMFTFENWNYPFWVVSDMVRLDYVC
jgi:hypothetical protein